MAIDGDECVWYVELKIADYSIDEAKTLDLGLLANYKNRKRLSIIAEL